jgi:solute carrier family 12 sodium/potassium/chloride transporter 2
MSNHLKGVGTKFGTAPVFLTAISTILGAIMFLRFGWAVGNLGFLGVAALIVVGHLVTIPTAMAIAEIATNQKVEGGGEYFIISRSFGLIIGASIGIALYLSQAISVAFYSIAFAQAFDPVFAWIGERWGVVLTDKRLVSVPAVLGITLLIVTRGADFGVKALWAVVAILFVSLLFFFLGDTGYHPGTGDTLVSTVSNPASFFLVFAICFPAFTGMTAGVGLSGDLRDPKRAIPLGTLSATLLGMVVYLAIAYKLACSAEPDQLVGDQLVMSHIALWGPIIPIGLACATLSSAIGSFLVAPRTLQAIAADEVMPIPRVSSWLARSRGAREPFNASLVTGAIALVFALLGDVDFVAQIISMFFMVSYGSICLISFLEHFAAEPSYRPAFRSRWYVSLLGAILCVWLMFQMSTAYAWLSIALMFGIYLTLVRTNPEKVGLSRIVQGVLFQLSRQIQLLVQKSRKSDEESWRPAVVCLSDHSFERHAAFDLMRWVSYRYGFGTYIHFIEGYVSREKHALARDSLQRLVALAGVSRSRVYVDTMVSPSYTTAIAQLVQIPGISGKENNMALFEFSKANPEELERIVETVPLVSSMGFDICLLGFSERGFGYRQEIHVWLTPQDYENANLMILLAYILLGHPDWKGAVIKIFSILQEDRLEEQEEALLKLIRDGRLPISAHNVEVVPLGQGRGLTGTIEERSQAADLVVLGFQGSLVRRRGAEYFQGYENIGNVLFVHTRKEIHLAEEDDEDEDPVAEPEGEAESAVDVVPAANRPERASEDEESPKARR